MGGGILYHEHEKRCFGFGGEPETDAETQCKRGVSAVNKGRPLNAFPAVNQILLRARDKYS
jgi:hypothetical protein